MSNPAFFPAALAEMKLLISIRARPDITKVVLMNIYIYIYYGLAFSLVLIIFSNFKKTGFMLMHVIIF
jgi:hypothetical protein